MPRNPEHPDVPNNDHAKDKAKPPVKEGKEVRRMALNHPESKNAFLSQLKGVLVGPRLALQNVNEFRDWLLTLGDDAASIKAELVSLYSFTAPEATVILNAVNSLHKLWLVATGEQAVTPAENFFTPAKRVWGYTPIR